MTDALDLAFVSSSVSAEAQEADEEPFEEKMRGLTATLREQQAQGSSLDAAIAANLKGLGYGG
jgi:type I restriction enzyme M protein